MSLIFNFFSFMMFFSNFLTPNIQDMTQNPPLPLCNHPQDWFAWPWQIKKLCYTQLKMLANRNLVQQLTAFAIMTHHVTASFIIHCNLLHRCSKYCSWSPYLDIVNSNFSDVFQFSMRIESCSVMLREKKKFLL